VVGFGEEVIDAENPIRGFVVGVKTGRKDDDVSGKVALAEMTHECQTVEARHLVVGDEKVKSVWLGGNQIERVLAVVGEDDGELGGGEK
jgi:hypothetical protein